MLDINFMIELLYNPVNYVHKNNLLKYFLDLSDSQINKLFINHWIIDYYRLEHVPLYWKTNSNSMITLIENWSTLISVSRLVGGFLNRSKLLTDIEFLAQERDILAFISLPIACHFSINDIFSNSRENLFAYGIAFIINLFPELPYGLLQRLLLCFPVDLPIPDIKVPQTSDNFNLLMMAITHAKNFIDRTTI